MNKRIVISVIALALLLAACGTSAPMASEPEYYGAPVTDERGLGGEGDVTNQSAPPMPTAVAYDPAKIDTGANTAIQERMVIMNVDLTLVVTDPSARAEAINDLAQSLGGWVVSMNMSQTYSTGGEPYPQVFISIRIPAEKLDNAIDQIKAGVVDIQYENRYSQDVTASYVDLQSQLNNLEQAEADLQAIMDEAKNNPGNDSTTKTQDVLNVYNQIVMIRGQIEQIKGQMKYYEESSSTSLINVTLIAEEVLQPLEIGPWTPKGAAQDAYKALVNFLRGFVEFMIWLGVVVLPVILIIFGPIALVVWLIVRGVRRNKAKKLAKNKQ